MKRPFRSLTWRLLVFSFLAIPLPGIRSVDRQSDKYSIGSTFQSKEMGYSTSPTAMGFTGIYNPANSCFMNAALQCLSNTRELRDYFLRRENLLFQSTWPLLSMKIESYYFVELNRTNPLGMQGAMAEELASVIKNLWSGQTNFINANRFRVRLSFFCMFDREWFSRNMQLNDIRNLSAMVNMMHRSYWRLYSMLFMKWHCQLESINLCLINSGFESSDQ